MVCKWIPAEDSNTNINGLAKFSQPFFIKKHIFPAK
jgi:hypothetical protein